VQPIIGAVMIIERGSGGHVVRFGARRNFDQSEGKLASARRQIKQETLLIRAGLFAPTSTASPRLALGIHL